MRQTALVIDDASIMRKLVAFTLRGADFDVIEAADGAEALRKLTGIRPDLIVTDVHMPEMDGIEFTRQARAAFRGRFVPIVFLTTECDEQRKIEARSAGATAWITKPYRPEQLLEVIARVASGPGNPGATPPRDLHLPNTQKAHASIGGLALSGARGSRAGWRPDDHRAIMAANVEVF